MNSLLTPTYAAHSEPLEECGAESLSPEALRLLALTLCATGRLDVRVLGWLLESVARGSWLTGFRQALGQPAAWAPDGAPCGLSPRELAVLRLVAIGRNNEEIGRVLAISRNTVASHLRSILGKTFTANRTEAAAFAYREGLLASFSAANAPRTPPAARPASVASPRRTRGAPG